MPVLGRCVNSNAQKWSFDIHRKEVHPQNAYDWCLDSDFDKVVRRPITVFRCGKTMSAKAETGHQQVAHLTTHSFHTNFLMLSTHQP